MPIDPKQFGATFLPYATRRGEELRRSQHTCMVHYTSAANFIDIVKGKQIWLRNSSVMNDFSEIQHGSQLLSSVRKSPLGDKFRNILDQHQAGVTLRDSKICLMVGFQHSKMKPTCLLLANTLDRKTDTEGSQCGGNVRAAQEWRLSLSVNLLKGTPTS